jgi:hypothetical protein
LQGGRGSVIEPDTKAVIELLEGISCSLSHTALIKELFAIVKCKILCFTPVHDIPDAAYQRIYSWLTAKYSKGIAIDYLWTRQNTNSLIQYRRQTQRIVKTYLANMKAVEADVPQPVGIFRAEFDYFKKDLVDKAFAAKRAQFGAIAAAMIGKKSIEIQWVGVDWPKHKHSMYVLSLLWMLQILLD